MLRVLDNHMGIKKYTATQLLLRKLYSNFLTLILQVKINHPHIRDITHYAHVLRIPVLTQKETRKKCTADQMLIAQTILIS